MRLLAIFLIMCSLVGCSESESGLKEPELLFHGGMDSVSIINNSGTLTFDGWNSLKKHAYVKDFDIANSGTAEYAYQEIVTNPNDASEQVLKAVVLDDDPTSSVTTRAQMTMRLQDGLNLGVLHTSIRMLFHNDVGFLKTYPSNISWFVIYETWTKRVTAWDGNTAGSARWNLNVRKDASSQLLYWVVDAEKMQPAAEEQLSIWTESNKDIEVPINKWFTLDFYLKRGEGSNGRLTIKLTPDGGQTTTLFDVKNTTVYPGHPEIELLNVQPFKFYFSDTYLDWMRTNGKTLACYYNDFKWYKD